MGPADADRSAMRRLLDLNIFHRHQANDPTDEKAIWVMNQLYDLLEQKYSKRPGSGRAPVLANVFRRDIYERAKALLAHEVRQLEMDAYEAVPKVAST